MIPGKTSNKNQLTNGGAKIDMGSTVFGKDEISS